MSHELNRRDFLRAATAAAGVLTAATVGRSLWAHIPATQPATDRSPMPQRILGKTGVPVPILGLGGAGMMSQSEDAEKIGELLQTAIAGGVTYFDTAYNYGRNGQCDKNLSLVMSTPQRRKLFLAAKVEERGYDGAMRQAEESLRRLKTDYVDLIQVHGVRDRDDVAAFGKPDGVLTALRKLQDQKVTRFIGMTGHPQYSQVAEALRMYAWDTFMGFMNPAAFCEPVWKTQLPLARERNIGFIAMKSLGGNTTRKPGAVAHLTGNDKGQATASRLLRYAWSQPVDLSIPGVTSIEQMRENIATAHAFKPMNASEQKRLEKQIREKKWRG
jgi:aryl-alcohol dehydrogenase-like predicted oxidoreductase